MHRLREVADFQEKKMKLSGARKQEDPADKPPKPGRPTGKGNGKGKDGKGEGERDSPAAA